MIRLGVVVELDDFDVLPAFPQRPGDSVPAVHHRSARGKDDGEGQIRFVVGSSSFQASPTGCDDLMSIWGGEALYMGAVEAELLTRGLGRPTLVVAQIDLSVSHTVSPSFPALNRLFAVVVLGTEKLTADVFYRADVPPGDVIAIVQPGNPEYDRHQGLPRA